MAIFPRYAREDFLFSMLKAKKMADASDTTKIKASIALYTQYARTIGHQVIQPISPGQITVLKSLNFICSPPTSLSTCTTQAVINTQN